jgi:hypothetical protein
MAVVVRRSLSIAFPLQPATANECSAKYYPSLERFTSCEELFTDLQAIGTVHVQCPYGRSPHRRQAHNQGALQCEVLFPAVASRVEQGRNCTPFRIDPPEVRAFMQIAVHAG